MQDYFDQPIAYNPDSDELERSAVFEVFAVDDTSFATPLTVLEAASGAPLSPLESSNVGVLPRFRVDGNPTQVVIKSGSFTTLLTSRYGAVVEAGLDSATVTAAIAAGDAATDAASTAAAAQAAAEQARADVEAVVATNDGIMTAVAADENSAFATQQRATNAALIAEDRSSWQATRAEYTQAPPSPDDVPAATWQTGITTGLSSPVETWFDIVGGGSQVTGWDGQDDPNFLISPGVFETFTGANQDAYLRGALRYGHAANRWPLIFSFDTSAGVDTIEIPMYGAANVSGMYVEVNGRMIADSGFWAPQGYSTGSMMLTLTFPTAKARSIRVWTIGAMQLKGVRVATGESVSKPSATLTVAIVGDSFVDGAGESGDWPDQGTKRVETFAARLARMLGADHVILAGLGGSSWLSGGTGTSTYEDRLSQIVGWSPDMVIFYGSTNDGTSPNATTLQAAVEDALDEVASIGQVFVIGPLRDGFGDNSAAVEAGTVAKSRPFINMNGFMFGTGKVTAKTGDGNNDWGRMDDGAHPTFAMHEAIARKAYALITAS